MDWLALAQALIPGLAGPASAVFICAGLLVFVGYITIKHILPSIEKRFTEAQGNINVLMSEHKADRETFQAAISTLTSGQTLMNAKVDDLVEEVKDLANKVESVFDKVERIDDDIDDMLKERK
jgi:predicted nuclease with TOPRIM domain